MATNRKAAVIFIFITVLLDVIGFGIIIPVLPALLSEIQSISINEASRYGGYLLFAFAIAQFIFSPFMGNLSDQYGRRPILLFSLFGFTVDYILLALASSFTVFLIGRIIAGFFGASFTTANAYIADISTDEDRSKNYGLIGAAFGAGFVVGPLLGGVLGEIDLRLPFYAAAGLTFLNFLYGYFILPESLPLENRRKFEWRKSNPTSTLKDLMKYKKLTLLFVALFVINIGVHAVNTNWSYFAMYALEWSEMMIGISLAFAGIVVGVAQVLFAQKAADYFGLGKSIYIGFALYALGMFLFSFANQTWMMYLFLIPYCLGSIAGPNLNAFMAKQVADNEQGKLQGGLTSIISLTTIIGPIVMTNIFYHFTSDAAPFHFPGAPFFLGGILMLASFIITYFALRNLNKDA